MNGSTWGGVTGPGEKAGGVPIVDVAFVMRLPRVVLLMEPTRPTIVQPSAVQEAVPVVVV
jgi:hypothetical protein